MTGSRRRRNGTMKIRIPSLAGGASLLLVASLAAPADAPTFAVAAGTKVRKTFTESTSWSVTSLTQRTNGTDMPLPPVDMRGRFEGELVLSDEYGATEDGRLRSLKRTVERAEAAIDAELETDGASEEHALQLESPLAGEVVLFDWNAERESYDVALESAGSAREWLEFLQEDADLRTALPPAGTEEGETWSLTTEDLTRLLHPGGSWSLWPTGLPDGAYQFVGVEEVLATSLLAVSMLDAELSGEGEVTWEETREVGGAQLAVLALRFELEADRDAGDTFEELLVQAGHESSREDLGLEIDWSLRGEGELVWNLQAGRFESLELQLESEIALVMRWLESYGDVEVEAEIEAELEASTVLAARVGGN